MSQDQAPDTAASTEDSAVVQTAEPISAEPSQGSPSRNGKGGAFVSGLIGGALVVALSAGGTVAAWPFVSQHLFGLDGTRLALLERETDDLSQKVAILQGEVSSRTDGAGASQATGVNQRLTSVEQRLASADQDPRLTSLSQKMDQAAADTARLHDEMTALRNAIPPEGTILRLAERAESAEKAAREISSQHAQAQALLLVVGQLRDAVDRGDPYDFELRATRRVAPPEEADTLEALSINAANGLPRRAALLNSFPLLAPAILRAGMMPKGDGVWHKAFAKLASLVTVRRVDGTGNDTASILARAERAVRDADLSKAAEELSALEGAPAEKAAPWIKDAQDRIAVDRAMSILAADAIAMTGKMN